MTLAPQGVFGVLAAANGPPRRARGLPRVLQLLAAARPRLFVVAGQPAVVPLFLAPRVACGVRNRHRGLCERRGAPHEQRRLRHALGALALLGGDLSLMALSLGASLLRFSDNRWQIAHITNRRLLGIRTYLKGLLY